MTETMWMLGGSGDVGRGIATAFGRRGWRIWISGRSSDRLDRAVELLQERTVDARGVTLDAADRSSVREAASVVADDVGSLSMLVYYVSPQSLDGVPELTANLRHTVGGLDESINALSARECTPEHVVVPTTSRARDPAAESPRYYAAKQAEVAYLDGYRARYDVDTSLLWLGRRDTESGWRWLRPDEMGARAVDAWETRETELLVGDRY